MCGVRWAIWNFRHVLDTVSFRYRLRPVTLSSPYIPYMRCPRNVHKKHLIVIAVAQFSIMILLFRESHGLSYSHGYWCAISLVGAARRYRWMLGWAKHTTHNNHSTSSAVQKVSLESPQMTHENFTFFALNTNDVYTQKDVQLNGLAWIYRCGSTRSHV